MEINNLLESANGYKSLQADSNRLATKWAASGLLEGLDEKGTANMAMILENQAKQIVAEANNTNSGGASFTAGAGEQWAGVALPLVRKVFSQIVAQDFVSVQPMNLPSGLVFYLDFKYGTATGGRADGDNMYGNVTDGATKMAADTDASGGLYGAGQFGYSVNEKSLAVSAQATGSASSSSIAYQDDKLPSDYATYVVDMSSVKFDKEAVRSFRLVSGSVDITNYPELTTVSGDNVTFVIKKTDFTAPTNGQISTSVKHSLQPVDNDRGDFEADSAAAVDTSITIPEIDVQLQSEAVVAKTRKLKAQWTPEFAQDLNAYHSIDAEAELTFNTRTRRA